MKHKNAEAEVYLRQPPEMFKAVKVENENRHPEQRMIEKADLETKAFCCDCVVHMAFQAWVTMIWMHNLSWNCFPTTNIRNPNYVYALESFSVLIASFRMGSQFGSTST